MQSNPIQLHSHHVDTKMFAYDVRITFEKANETQSDETYCIWDPNYETCLAITYTELNNEQMSLD